MNSTSSITVVNNDLIFALDGKAAGNYTHIPNDPDYAYNVNFFAKDKLDLAPHNLSMLVNGTSMVLFDYMVYTTKYVYE